MSNWLKLVESPFDLTPLFCMLTFSPEDGEITSLPESACEFHFFQHLDSSLLSLLDRHKDSIIIKYITSYIIFSCPLFTFLPNWTEMGVVFSSFFYPPIKRKMMKAQLGRMRLDGS